MAAEAPLPYSTQTLYAFTLPLELLDHLSIRLNALTTQDDGPSPSSASAAAPREEAASALGCAACGVNAFGSLPEQRQHFRTDWHRYNVRLKLSSNDKPPVAEEAFNGLVDSLDESLSGSASSDSDASTSSSTNAVSRLLKSTHVHNDGPEARTASRSPLIWSTADAVAPDTQFGLYRVLFPTSDVKGRIDPPEGWIPALRALQVQPDIPKLSKKAAAARHVNEPAASNGPVTAVEARTWAFFFVGGGHFAGMVVSLVPKLTRGQGGKLESGLNVLAHKTFHRYTTRRKQGGAQSANDNAKGNAKSVGAQIRRSQEVTLIEDIRALLTDWKDLLATTELVFMRASRSNHRIFYDYEGAVLERGGARIRSVPFSTRRPTLAELERCFHELTRVKISHLTADALAALDEAELKKLAPPAPVQPSTPSVAVKAPATPKLSKEEEAARDRWERVVDMARRGRVDALASFLERNTEESYTGMLPEWLGDHRTPTLLHVATQADQPEMVRWLLYDRRVDPALRSNGEDAMTMGRPAYDLATSKATRNVYRRCMADHPEWHDWSGAAHVPSPLTAEQEAKERARDEVKRRAREREEAKAATAEAEKVEAERAEREAKERERAAKVAAAQAAKGGPQRLGGGPPAKVVGAQMAGLTEEQKLRAERERRARAAEARSRG